MSPYFIILIIASIGTFVDGVVGFFVWGIAGFAGVSALSWILNRVSGGLLPRKVRDETATDFLMQFQESVLKAYPGMTPYQQKQEIANLLEQMYKKATLNNPSMNLNNAGNAEIFLTGALEVVQEQKTKELKEMATDLVNFVRHHHLWYSHV